MSVTSTRDKFLTPILGLVLGMALVTWLFGVVRNVHAKVKRQDIATVDETDKALNSTSILQQSWVKMEEGYDFGGRATPFLGDVDGDGRVEVVSPADNEVVLLSGTGEVEWRFDLRGSVECVRPDWLGTSPVAVDLDGNGTKEVLVGSTHLYSSDDPSCNPCLESCPNPQLDGVLYALNGKTGQEIWEAHFPALYSSPAVADLNADGQLEVVVGYGNYEEEGAAGGVKALNALGQVIWDYQTGNAVDSTPAVFKQGGAVKIAFTSEDSSVYVVSANGALLWSASPVLHLPNGFCVGSITSSPGVGNIIGDDSPEIVFGNDCGGVFA